MYPPWIEAVIIGVCIGFAVVLVEWLVPEIIWLRATLLTVFGIALSLIQYALNRRRRPD